MTPFAWTAATLTAVVAGWLVSTAPREAPPSPPTPGPMTVAAATERIGREVVEPLRERHLGIRSFSRAGPRFDEKSLRAVVAQDFAPTDAFIPFRVEVDTFRGKKEPVVQYVGRIDRATGAIELAPGSADPKQPTPWRPASAFLSPEDDG